MAKSGYFLWILGVPCDSYQLVTCGDNTGQTYDLHICEPTVQVRSITSVHMDTRFTVDSCKQRYFGLTTDRLSIWVYGYCFGTFLVCYEQTKLPPENATANTPAKFASTSTEPTIRTRTSPGKDNTNTTQIVSLAKEYVNSIYTTTDAANTSSLYNGTAAGSPHTPYRRGPMDEPMADYDTSKVVTVSGIYFGGALIVILAVAVAALVRKSQSSKSYKTKREQSTAEDSSMATLISMETETCNIPSVYDVIPFDMERKVPALYTTEENVETYVRANRYAALPVVPMCDNTETDKDTRADNHRLYSHISMDTDTEYDHLIHTCRKVSGSDSNPYDTFEQCKGNETTGYTT